MNDFHDKVWNFDISNLVHPCTFFIQEDLPEAEGVAGPGPDGHHRGGRREGVLRGRRHSRHHRLQGQPLPGRLLSRGISGMRIVENCHVSEL